MAQAPTALPETTVTAPAPSSPSTKLDPRQTWSDLLETGHSHLDGRQAAIHSAMPGIIVSFNAAAMTVVVQPALQGIRTMQDGSIQNVTIAHLPDVPVFFPCGGGHTLTFPIAAGDECLLVFNERSIDNWWQLGNVQKPSDWRMHDINDAVALVGIRSQPRVLGGGGGGGGSVARAAAPQTSTSTAQLRSDDGKTVVQVDGPNTAIIHYANGSAGETHVFIDGNGGAVTVTAPQEITLTAGGGSRSGGTTLTLSADGSTVGVQSEFLNINASNTVTITAPNVLIKSPNFASTAS